MSEEEKENTGLHGVLISDPKSPLFAPLANLYLEDGMVDEAIQLCLSGLENYPDSLDGHLVLGKAYLKRGDWELARDELKMVLSLDRTNEEARSSLGQMQATAASLLDPLTAALAELKQIEGVQGVLVLAEGGRVIRENLAPSLDGGTISSLLGPLFSKADKAMSELEFGNLDNAILEMGKTRAYLFRAGPSILAVLTDRSTTLGLVMLEVRRTLPALERLLRSSGKETGK